jgi:GT2 family glycosyltransferase
MTLRICATVTTFNRRDLLLECLTGLAEQTVPVDRVFVIDNASTDGTREAVAASGLADRLDIGYIVMQENAGPAAGVGEGFRQALAEGFDWVWVFDSDCIAQPEALQTLMSSPEARAPDTAALAPALLSPVGHWQVEHRGVWSGLPSPLPESAYADPAVEIDYAAWPGLLVRASAIEAAGLPKVGFFIPLEDVEWCLRAREHGRIWMLPQAVCLHKEQRVQVPDGPFARYRRALRPASEQELWRHIYCFRNMSWMRRARNGEGIAGFVLHLSQHWTRVLLFDPDKVRRMRWYLEYGLAGRRGEFRNCPPTVWVENIRKRGGYQTIREASEHGVSAARSSGPFDPRHPL